MTMHINRITNPSQLDRFIYSGYRAANFYNLGRMGLRQGPRRMLRAFKRYPWLNTLSRINNLHKSLTLGRRERYREANAVVVSSFVSAICELVEGILAHPDRTVIHEDMIPPEILRAMGLCPWMAELLSVLLPIIDSDSAIPYIDIAESSGLPPDLCSIPKSTLGLVLSGQMPEPAAIVSSNMPCDGGMAQYTLIERYLKRPAFYLDTPYHFMDEQAVDYFARQLEEMIAWLETHTPGKMDWDQLRQICEERNRVTELELELWDLLRHRPAPLAAEPIYLAHFVFTLIQPGTPHATRAYRRVLQLARENFRKGVGALEKEQFRVGLWNPPTVMFSDFFGWAEQTYGVALIMDMLTFHRSAFIDTSTPQSMLKDLARMMMNGPMARHTRGPADNFFRDLFLMVQRFGLDMIWMTGHIGCKNTQALIGMLRERCRKREIPLLVLDFDITDPRVVSKAGICDQVKRFMESVMRADPLII